MLLPLSSGRDINPTTPRAVGTKSISPMTMMTIEPTAGMKDLTQASDRKPAA